MRQNRIQLALMAALVVALILIAILGVRAANPPAPPPPPPTVDVAAVMTEAINTFAGGLTSTAQAVPTATQTASPVPTATAAGTPSTGSPPPTPSCYRLKYVQDVTIPDATIMTPAQVFTKTWQVQNTGTCALRAGFQLVLVGGVAMGGSPFVLSTAITPGTKFNISIKMAAPTTQTGLIQGTWRMIDDNSQQFGDALTVVIVIGNSSAAVPTAAPTSTP